MKRLLVALLIAMLPAQSWGQATVLQGGSWTVGAIPQYSSSGGSQPIVRNGGNAGGGAVGANPAQLGITARGTGTPPYVAQGSGPSGEILCLYDAPTDNATGYHSLCLSPNVGSKALLSYQAGGSASAQGLNFLINGTTYEFPFVTSGIVGPGSSVVNDMACWNNTSGTLLKDCGVPLSIGGSANQVQYNNAGALGGFTVGGDATLNTGTGALTVTKINNVAVSLGGALTTGGPFITSGASSLTLTTSGVTNVSLPASGTLATLAGSEALTNKTYNGNTWTSGTGTLTIGAGKTLSISNTVTFTATDGSTLAIGTGGTLGTAAYTASTAYMPSGTQITNAIAGDVALNNNALFFDGPTIAQGSTGTWFVVGTVSLVDTGGAANFSCKLWDGTTVINSGFSTTAGPNNGSVQTLSGYLASPAGNLRVSCKDTSATTGAITANAAGSGANSSRITAFRVQ